MTLRDGAWHLQLVKRLVNTEATREEPEKFIPAITCILPMAQVVYTGDEEGKVVSHISSFSFPYHESSCETSSRIKIKQ